MAAYGVSKAALDAMTVAIAQELGAKGATINNCIGHMFIVSKVYQG